MEDTHTSDEDGLTEEAWEIKVTIKMKCKMAGPWQTSIILKLIVWIRLEQLPIEHYHPDFLKHVGNKLGKLLKIDVVTSAASHGRFARLCVQFNITCL
ncbi:hypothetical protein CFP56_041360 [Quercus suber]|uniref:DUF4283 domain-containing protein n=1 Tax=Quercus suber TaxID=58331 RepID=A0AAW0IVU5_QUESU